MRSCSQILAPSSSVTWLPQTWPNVDSGGEFATTTTLDRSSLRSRTTRRLSRRTSDRSYRILEVTTADSRCLLLGLTLKPQPTSNAALLKSYGINTEQL